MSKLMKSLTLGVAAAAIVVASSAANAYCPRGGGGYYKSGYSNNYGGQYKKYYKKKYYKKSYYKKETYGYDKPEYEADDKDDEVVEGDTDGPGEVAFDMGSRIFEISEKENCTEKGCDGLTLRDAEGVEIEISSVEYAEELYEGSSVEELNYHLGQNGSALRGRLQEIREDGEISYGFICEKIYS